MIYEIPWPMLLSKFLPLLVLYFSLFNIHSHTPEENFPILTCEPDFRGEFFTSEIMGSIVLSNTNGNSGSILATLYKKLKYFTYLERSFLEISFWNENRNVIHLYIQLLAKSFSTFSYFTQVLYHSSFGVL